MFKVLFDTENFYIYCSKVSPFDGPITRFIDIAHQTFTLRELIAAPMVTKGLLAAQLQQLCLFTTSQMQKVVIHA